MLFCILFFLKYGRDVYDVLKNMMLSIIITEWIADKIQVLDNHKVVPSGTATLPWWRGLGALMILGAMLSGAICPWQGHPRQIAPR